MRHFLDTVTDPIGYFVATGRRAVVSDRYDGDLPVAQVGLAFEASPAEYGEPIELSYVRTGAVRDPDNHGPDSDIYVVWPRVGQTTGPVASDDAPVAERIDSYDRAVAAQRRLATEGRRGVSPRPDDYPAEAEKGERQRYLEAKAEIARRLAELRGEPVPLASVNLHRVGYWWDWRRSRYTADHYRHPNWEWAGRQYQLLGLSADEAAYVLAEHYPDVAAEYPAA